MSRRDNTFRVDYSNVPKKPSIAEVHDFIGTVLEVKNDELVRIQFSRILGCAFVTTTELSVAQRVVELHDSKHEVSVENKQYKLRIKLEDGAVEVKLFDLSADVSDEEITSFLSEYGEVLSIRELVWDDKYRFAGIPTGVRVVRMMLNENIPSYITIAGEMTCVSYYGQRQTCRHCGDQIHNGVSCVVNKKLLVQKSFANIAKLPAAAAKLTKPTVPTNKQQTSVSGKAPAETGSKSTPVVNTASSKKQQTKTNNQKQHPKIADEKHRDGTPKTQTGETIKPTHPKAVSESDIPENSETENGKTAGMRLRSSNIERHNSESSESSLHSRQNSPAEKKPRRNTGGNEPQKGEFFP